MGTSLAKSFSIILVFLVYSSDMLLSVNCEALVPCYFVFGDSLVDNGNNNARNTLAKANYPPYGIDFPGGPTGRFSNGRNVADFIAEFLGFTNHIPPFANARGDALVNGVNYASGGAGILRTTGKQLGDLISLDEQLMNHRTTINRITAILGNADSANKHLGQCIYLVDMGSNDYASYAMGMIPSTPEQFADILIREYSRQLRDLYNLGARKVALFGLGTIGCVPASLNGGLNAPFCLTTTTATAGVFNAKLKSLVDDLNRDLYGSKFTYVDVFGITASDPSFQGFKNKYTPCCYVFGVGACAFGGITCPNRSDFEYFDGFHPTETAAMILAKRAFTAQSPSDAYPSDIQHLAHA